MTDDLRERLQTSLGHAYTIENELGGGGMSRVFSALDTSLGRRVVVKVLPVEMMGPVSLERFKREILLAARLQHPHIIPVLTAGEFDGMPYYTMPFVPDESLRKRLERGSMSLSETVRTLREIARALAYAHGEGVVHRDIKPENVLLTGGVAAVCDFGVAKAVSDATTLADGGKPGSLTSIGMALGTPAYISPEQASGETDIDQRADIYSFGCMAYELLSGAPPFTGRAIQKLLAAHVMEPPPPLASKYGELPTELVALVMQCLAKRPEDRPANAGEILTTLENLPTLSGGRTATASAPAARRAGRFSRPLLVGGVALGAIMLWGAFKLSKGSGSATGTTDNRSIAVVPFTTLNGQGGTEYFSEGITEEITDALTHLPGLHVTAHSVVAAEQARESDVRKIGRALNVYAVLAGTVQHDGNKVRISAQLVNTATGQIIWTDRYDDELKDVFVVQDKIARAIVNGLQLQLSGTGTALVRSQTASPEAHNDYLQGIYFWNRRTASTIRKAMEFFQDAIRKDSSYGRAYAGLALSYAVLTDYADLDATPILDSAVKTARHALTIDSTLAGAWTAIGMAQGKSWRLKAADSAMRRALALDSTDGTAHHWYAFLLANLGRPADAVREIQKARDLEPLSLIINSNVGRMMILARRYDEAKTALQHAMELDPNFAPPHEHLASIYLHEKQYDKAIDELKKRIDLNGTRPSQQVALLGEVYAEAGKMNDARAIRDELVGRAQREKISNGGLALVDWVLGEHDAALVALERAVNERDTMLYLMGHDERFDAMWKDPRAGAILKRTETGD